MPKINQEEYEVLKGLDDKWKWIARDKKSRWVWLFKENPCKGRVMWEGDSSGVHYAITKGNFCFIQWEDESPYNIQELIEEYESEETEVKDLEWLKRSIDKRIKTIESDDITFVGSEYYDEGYIDGMRDVLYRINQLDEPEVLSQKWISENVEYAYFDMLDGSGRLSSATAIIKPKKLRNLLVPKREELTDEQIARKVDRAYKDGYEKGKQHTFYKGYLEGLTDKKNEPKTVADVVTTFWKSYERLKEVMSMEVEELEE